ncbi:hypothetical protein [Methylobacterium sp. JK268]
MEKFNVEVESNSTTHRIPDVIAGERNKQLVVDAVYLVVRVLRNHLRGYKDLAVSSEAGSEAALLAKRAIDEIEKIVGSPVSEISEATTNKYIELLAHVQSEKVLQGKHSSSGSEVEVLNNMRSQRI